MFPFNPLSPTPNKQMQTIPGKSGDWADNNHTYASVETQINAVIHMPKRYSDWEQLKGDIEDWLYGDEDWLRFRRDSDYLYRAQIVTAPVFTPVNFERINATLTFNFQPFKYDADSIHWLALPQNGVVINPEPEVVRPDWHINGTGSFLLKVNDMSYEFDDIDGDIYLVGEEGNAYSSDPTKNYLTDNLLNSHLRLANNSTPELLSAGNGINTVTIEPLNADSKLNAAEFIPRWRRLI